MEGDSVGEEERYEVTEDSVASKAFSYNSFGAKLIRSNNFKRKFATKEGGVVQLDQTSFGAGWRANDSVHLPGCADLRKLSLDADGRYAFFEYVEKPGQVAGYTCFSFVTGDVALLTLVEMADCWFPSKLLGIDVDNVTELIPPELLSHYGLFEAGSRMPLATKGAASYTNMSLVFNSSFQLSIPSRIVQLLADGLRKEGTKMVQVAGNGTQCGGPAYLYNSEDVSVSSMFVRVL